MNRLRETQETQNDMRNLMAYMSYHLKNSKAAIDFLTLYRKRIQTLILFPLAHRGTNFAYQGYEIRIKTFSSYNIFFVIDENEHQITILRVLKDRQNWKGIFQNEAEYSF